MERNNREKKRGRFSIGFLKVVPFCWLLIFSAKKLFSCVVGFVFVFVFSFFWVFYNICGLLCCTCDKLFKRPKYP